MRGGNDVGLRAGAGKMLGGGGGWVEAVDAGAGMGRWVAATGSPGGGSSDGGPRRQVLLSSTFGWGWRLLLFFISLPTAFLPV